MGLGQAFPPSRGRLILDLFGTGLSNIAIVCSPVGCCRMLKHVLDLRSSAGTGTDLRSLQMKLWLLGVRNEQDLICCTEEDQVHSTRTSCVQAEKLNGRAAMVGYAMAWVVDGLSGAGLQDQQNSFLGKLLLHIAVFGILIFRLIPTPDPQLLTITW